ncbi:MAG TPA: CARDB domain-containing protein [Candidatus Nitrosotenuis sp.]|nr:CARDB domain-containing protein [Candidatus Nitrosotenuis sp.]
MGGYAGTVTLTVGALPTGVTVNPPSITQPIAGLSTNINLQFFANSNASPGLFQVPINVTDGTITVNQNVTVQLLADFTMTASPVTGQNTPIVLLPGQSQNINIDIQSINNYAACSTGTAVALSVSGSLPTGVTANATATADLGSPGTLTVDVAAGAPSSGVFQVFVSGSGNSDCTQSFQSISAFFTVGPTGFSIPSSFGTVFVNIGSGGLSSSSVTVTPLGNFAGTVTFTVTQASVPAGVTVTPATAVVQAGATQTFQVRADPPATAGSAQFQFTVTDGTTTLTGTVPLQLRGSYTLTVSPANSSSAPAVVAPGQSVNYTVTVNPLNGFTGTVDINRFCFGCGSPPAGITITGSLTASPGSPGTITVTAATSAIPTGPGGVTFVSSSANSFSSPSFGFFSAVGPPVFRVTNSTSVQSPTSIVINGSTRNIFVSVQSLGGYSGTVTLTLGQLPAGLTASPQTGQVFVPSGSSAGFSFTFQAATGLAQGPIDVFITGSDGTNSFNSFIYMFAISNIGLVANPPSTSATPLRLIPGDTVGQTVNIQVLSVGGFTGSIPLSVTSNPSNLTIVPNPNPPTVAANGAADFQITAPTGAAGGLTSVTIQATFGGISQSTTLFFFIGVGSFTMSTSPPSSSTNPIALDPNGTTLVPVTVTITPQQGFLGSVDITPQALPAGVTVAPASTTVNVTSANPVSATFNFSATVPQGLTPITVIFDASSTVATSAGPVQVTAQATSDLLVNPPSFSLSQSAGTSGSHISLEQGIPPGTTFQITVNGLSGFTGTVTLSFANVPAGLNISPTTVNVPAGSSATFSIDAGSNSALGSFVVSVIGSSGVQSSSLSLFVDIVQPTNGFFFTTSPPTSTASPILLQPDATLITFLNLNVNAKGTFTGMVDLALSNVPAGVTMTITPSTVDLSLGPTQVAVVTFQTSTGLAAFGPSVVTVTGTSGNLQAVAGIVVALQVTSAIQNPSGSNSLLRAPQVKSVQPATGQPGSYTLMLVSGESLAGITQVLSSSPLLVPRLEPGANDTQMRISVFVRPNAEPGSYTFMLSGPRGSVPVAFEVGEQAELDGEMPKSARANLPGIRRGNLPRGVATRDGDADSLGSGRAVVTRVEPASIRPGETVEGRILGRQLDSVTAVRSAGEGVTVEILENSGSEMRVRIAVAPGAASGSRLLSLDAGGETLRAQVQIAAAPRVPVAQSGPRVGNRTSGEVAESSDSGAPDLSVQVADISMSPSNPRAGDDVIFRVRVSNSGTKRVEDAIVEFSLSGTSVRLRENVSLDAGASQNFQFEWQATGSGRIEPRVTLDPESKLADANRANNSAALPAFELVAAAASGGKPGPAPRAAARERAQVVVLAGTCQGFRLTSGTDQECGGADVEFNVSSQGGVMRIEAEGVRNLGAVDLGQPIAMPKGSLAATETLQAGSTYIVATRRGNFVLRVSEIRGVESLRNAPAGAMARPRVRDLEREPAASGSAKVTLVLEWRAL